MTSERSTGQMQNAMYDNDGGEHRIPLAQTTGPIELDVSNSSGEVTVRAGSGPDALVRFQKTSGRGNDAQLVIDVRESRIKILTRNEGGLGGLLKRGHGSFDIEVELPRERLVDGSGKVRVNTASGEIVIEDIPGEVRVNSASGDVQVAGAAGEVTARTASGDVALIRPRGEVTAQTASGDVHIQHAVLSRFAIATASGDTHLSGELTGSAASKVETVSGDVSLQIEGIVVSELRYATVSGDATVEGTFRKVSPRTWRMGDADGGPTISVKTVSGDLHVDGRQSAGATATEPIRQTERENDTLPFTTMPTPPTAPAPPTPPTPPTAPMPSNETHAVTGSSEDDADGVAAIGEQSPIDEAERLEVLQALERGEIDIEEALSRLGESDEPTEI